MTKSTDLLLGRRRELYTLIRDAVVNYADEINQINKMLVVAGVDAPLPYDANGAGKDDSSEPRNVNQQIHAVLEGYPEGLPSREITEKVNMRFGREIKSSSMSWHLSHLKKDGEVVLENRIWRLPADQDELELVDPEPEKEKTNQAAE